MADHPDIQRGPRRARRVRLSPAVDSPRSPPGQTSGPSVLFAARRAARVAFEGSSPRFHAPGSTASKCYMFSLITIHASLLDRYGVASWQSNFGPQSPLPEGQLPPLSPSIHLFTHTTSQLCELPPVPSCCGQPNSWFGGPRTARRGSSGAVELPFSPSSPASAFLWPTTLLSSHTTLFLRRKQAFFSLVANTFSFQTEQTIQSLLFM
jgi:hypothetical protein